MRRWVTGFVAGLATAACSPDSAPRQCGAENTFEVPALDGCNRCEICDNEPGFATQIGGCSQIARIDDTVCYAGLGQAGTLAADARLVCRGEIHWRESVSDIELCQLGATIPDDGRCLHIDASDVPCNDSGDWVSVEVLFGPTSGLHPPSELHVFCEVQSTDGRDRCEIAYDVWLAGSGTETEG